MVSHRCCRVRRQHKNSHLEYFILSAGSKFLKHDINCSLNSEYGSISLNGIINLKNVLITITGIILLLTPHKAIFFVIQAILMRGMKALNYFL